MSKATSYMPVRKSVLDDPKLMGTYLQERPRLKATMRQMAGREGRIIADSRRLCPP